MILRRQPINVITAGCKSYQEGKIFGKEFINLVDPANERECKRRCDVTERCLHYEVKDDRYNYAVPSSVKFSIFD